MSAKCWNHRRNRQRLYMKLRHSRHGGGVFVHYLHLPDTSTMMMIFDEAAGFHDTYYYPPMITFSWNSYHPSD